MLARAIDGCRAATRAHIRLPPAERVDVEYVRELSWSAFTRYQGGFTSRIQVNAGLPLTVDRALDLACHEAYPGHHTIASLLEARFGGRVEFLVQPLFSPQSLLHEAASSLAGALAFPEPARTAFERDELFPLAGLDPGEAGRHVRVGRLVDELHGVHADIARRYLDGGLDFPRAALALERDALMPSADATLKFLNQYRTYAATYTIGRDELMRHIDAHSSAGRRGEPVARLHKCRRRSGASRAARKPLGQVVQAFRPAVSGGSEGPHYTSLPSCRKISRRQNPAFFKENDMRRWLVTLGMLVAVVGCSREPSTPAAAAAPPAQPKLGIRPHGDTEIQIDMAKIQSEELKKVFAYIDEHVDEHVVNLQKWIRQPSISNSGEGIPETAEMVKGFFDQLGCQESRVYDVGITEWGAPGNPGRLCALRRRRPADDRDLLAVRHDAGDAARRVDRAAVRRRGSSSSRRSRRS